MFTRLGLPMNHFFLQKTKLCQFILYSRIETARHLVRSDFFFFFFAKIYTNFEIRRRIPRVKNNNKNSKLTNFNKNTHTSLSLLVDPPMECLLWCACTSLSLSLYMCKHGLDPDQTRMVFRQFKNVCMRWKVRKVLILWNVRLCRTKAW